MSAQVSAKVASGMAWTIVERMSVQLCQFVIGIVLARVLLPSDYGTIGMLAIFIAIAQSFLDSGFNRALIQKKDRTNTDYSTVFYFNLVVSVVLYLLFFWAAPYIARFYSTPILTEVSRVVFLSIIVNAFSLVQTAKLTIELNFRLQSLASIVSIILSGALGIIMAYRGYGIWSLVAQNLSSGIVRTLILWIFSHWKPLFVFSMDSFKGLFSFGSKLLVGDFIHTIYTNLYTLVIGKAFNPTSVGYYNMANRYALLPNTIFSQVVNKVMFPVLSEKQNDNTALLNAYNMLFRLPMFLYTPLMFGVAALAKPLICVMIGEKWVECVPLLQILCIGFVFAPMSAINLNLLYVKGRSDISLKLDLIKKPLGIVFLFVSVPFGIWWMCFGKALYELIAFSMNCFYTKKILNYGFKEQILSLFPILVSSTIMFIAILLINNLFSSYWMMILIGIIGGFCIYIGLSACFKEEALGSYYRMIRNFSFSKVYNRRKKDVNTK